MKNSLEIIIERFTRLTHSPRGQYAASDETYQQLLSRLSEAPMSQTGNTTSNTINTIGSNIDNTTIGNYTSKTKESNIGNRNNAESSSANSHRWSAAASVALIVGIGIAIAGVYTFRGYIFSSTQQPTEISVPTAPQIRTLAFDNIPLSDIVASLSEAYSTEIIIADQDLASYCITATFSTDESLPDILDALSLVSGFRYHLEDDKYIIEK